jgi:hypothetical protein
MAGAFARAAASAAQADARLRNRRPFERIVGLSRGAKESAARHANETPDEIAVPLRLRTHAGLLSLFSTITVFGTPVEIALSELSVEAFYPADEATAEILRAAHSGST